ncbi:PspC domain-containing protein [Isoptericola halotolerans]|uniref:Phage shock protein PspC (Stress-responsive transcriptional regulator) n=1 Tax=Isoptericola halotolerans TaxID=300560 RepID=A0ABX2A7E0_9MICO|nr:PspC domain-containing protein [Isoptericola halotolerans]NOV98571.1 phage shock protein PspC (stress-responsive transcriptional regulator) [Isoptericola halotolerans]
MSTPQTTPRPQKLYRPGNGRVFGGVCAGIADYFGWSRGLVRLLTALSVLIPGPQVLAYIVFWILMPDERKAYGHA